LEAAPEVDGVQTDIRYAADRCEQGEPTLNRRWLIEASGSIWRMNPGARLHLDSRRAILSEEYVDELLEACAITSASSRSPADSIRT